LDEVTADRPSEVIRALLAAEPRPTALFIPADTYAPHVYAVCAELGLRIPEDISVIGYADLALARDLKPGLTTLAQDPYAIGVQAARQVLARCRGTAEPGMVHIRLMPNLVVRGSTGPCITSRG
jgi:DNA-binding LacI/PurR family transcriptional regulator